MSVVKTVQPNLGKQLNTEIGQKHYIRYPIKTHFIEPSDDLNKIIERYVLPAVEDHDIVALGQKVISILQGRIVYKKDIKVGFWANFLSKFAKKTPYGFSVGNPLKMQVAIDLAGLPRIFLASALAGICKLFRVYGIFYRVAGNQISQMDGFYGEAFPQYENVGILGPVDCDKLCDTLREKYAFSFFVADINDIGGNILGISKDLKGKENMLLDCLKDNPAGQSVELTPIILIREIK